jgi:hypothetical protein
MSGAKEPGATGTVPFWAHQLAEMLLGGLLLIEGARTGQHTAVLVGMGSALLLLSLLSDGALGAWPRIGRRLHRVLDFVAAGILAVSPLVLSLDAVLAIVILEATALGMVWLALRTNWKPRRARRPAAKAPRPAADPVAPVAPAAPTPPPAAAPEPPIARKLGAAVGKARDDGPRQLGRAVGRARNRLREASATPPKAPDPPPDPPEPPAAPAGPG